MVPTVRASSTTCLLPEPRAAPSTGSAVDKDVVDGRAAASLVPWKASSLGSRIQSDPQSYGLFPRGERPQAWAGLAFGTTVPCRPGLSVSREALLGISALDQPSSVPTFPFWPGTGRKTRRCPGRGQGEWPGARPSTREQGRRGPALPWSPWGRPVPVCAQGSSASRLGARPRLRLAPGSEL